MDILARRDNIVRYSLMAFLPAVLFCLLCCRLEMDNSLPYVSIRGNIRGLSKTDYKQRVGVTIYSPCGRNRKAVAAGPVINDRIFLVAKLPIQSKGSRFQDGNRLDYAVFQPFEVSIESGTKEVLLKVIKNQRGYGHNEYSVYLDDPAIPSPPGTGPK